LHARTFDLDPASSIFIDDSLPNVDGAKAAGWQAVHFTGAEKLRADLATYGIDV
jgi:2-haloacid dehalogenase